MPLTQLKFDAGTFYVTSTRMGAYRSHVIDKANSTVLWRVGRPDRTEYRIRKFCRWDLPMNPKWELHTEPPPGFPVCVACDREYKWFVKHGSRRLWVKNEAGRRPYLQSARVRPNINPPF